MKLPEKKYEPKHNDELREYAIGWNTTINCVECWCNRFGDEEAKKLLLTEKEIAYEYEYKDTTMPIYKGVYDCIIEIEKLNELDLFFQEILEALDINKR